VCKNLDDTSQQVDSGIEWDRIYLYTGVIVLIYNIDRDKQLNTADSLDFPEAINVSQLCSLNNTIRQSI